MSPGKMFFPSFQNFLQNLSFVLFRSVPLQCVGNMLVSGKQELLLVALQHLNALGSTMKFVFLYYPFFSQVMVVWTRVKAGWYSPDDLVTQVRRTGKRGKVLLVKTSHGLTFRRKTCLLALSRLKQHVISLSLALKQSSELLLSRPHCKLNRVGLWELNCHYSLTLARAKAEIECRGVLGGRRLL